MATALLATGALTILSQLDPATVFEHRLKTLAGRGATDCEQLTPTSDDKATSDCILGVFAKHKAFYAIHDTQQFEIDSHLIDGLAGDKSGNLYDVEFSSMGRDPNGVSDGSTLVDGGHVSVEACPKPIALKKCIYRGLTCIHRIMVQVSDAK